MYLRKNISTAYSLGGEETVVFQNQHACNMERLEYGHMWSSNNITLGVYFDIKYVRFVLRFNE